MLIGLFGVSAIGLGLFLAIYHQHLEEERSRASIEINRLLQASLENAMLKRDLGGLREIIRRLGQQKDIRLVMIVNPAGEVRFSSDPRLLNQQWNKHQSRTCRACHRRSPPPWTRFMRNEQGQEVLRSVNPVRNKAPCSQCHGSPKQHPVNGVLFVDYDAATIRTKAWRSALALAGTGGLLMVAVLLWMGWLIRRWVTRPVMTLARASERLSRGQWDVHVPIPGHDEIARLGRTFNHMVDALKGAYARIEEQRDFLQAIIDAIPDGIRVLDRHYQVVVVNDTFCQQAGLTREEVLAQPCYASAHGRQEPCSVTQIMCPLHELSQDQETLRAFHEHWSSRGDKFYVDLYVQSVDVMWKGVPRKLVVESIRDLSRIVDFSLEQRLFSLGRLAAGVAHEIRNPMSSVHLAVQAILRLVESGHIDSQQLKSYLSLMDKQMKTCLDVTERLLKLSPVSGEKAQPVDINTAVREVISLLAFEAEVQGISVEQDLDESHPHAMITESDLRILILNLIQNAFHAMPKGGKLRVSTRLEEGRAILEVEDTGVGISPYIRPFIFEPFFSQRADGQRGTGLGLAICRAIVERHGGQIDVESEMGKGSRFIVQLPSS